MRGAYLKLDADSSIYGISQPYIFNSRDKLFNKKSSK